MTRLFISFTSVLILFSACKEIEIPDELQNGLETLMSVEEVSDVVILYSDNAQLKARIVGTKMRRSLDNINPYDEFLDGVVVDFYNEKGEPESHLTSDYAIRYTKKGEVIARDPNGVILNNEEGDTLISSELIWLDRDDKIMTDKFVYIRTEGRKIWGQGFESNMDFSKGRIRAVEGEMVVDDLTQTSE
jgi:LPS export ABC transporter protein LptC